VVPPLGLDGDLSWEEYCEQLEDPENDVLPA
jgi:hypothetical protein